VLPAAVAGVGLHVDTTAHVFYLLLLFLLLLRYYASTVYAVAIGLSVCPSDISRYCNKTAKSRITQQRRTIAQEI